MQLECVPCTFYLKCVYMSEAGLFSSEFLLLQNVTSFDQPVADYIVYCSAC